MFLVLLFMFMDSLSYLFVYHEEQQLFLFTRAYAAGFLVKPGLLSDYIANFVAQFFYLFVTGKIVFAFIFSCLYLFPTCIVRKWMGGKVDPFQVALLLPLYLFIRFEASDFKIAWATSLFVCFLLLFLCSRLPKWLVGCSRYRVGMALSDRGNRDYFLFGRFGLVGRASVEK